VQNEPNSSPRVGSAGAKRAKRTQCPKRGPEAVSSIADCGFRKACAPAPELAGPGIQTNPIGRSQSCKTKPIPAGRDAPWGPGFPARPSGLAVNCAKQSQFRRVGRGKTIVKAGGLDDATRHRGKCATSPRCPASGNKANSSIADCRLPRFARNDMSRIGDKPTAGPASLRRGQVPGGRRMRNKANSRQPGRGPGIGVPLSPLCSPGQLRQTNPISAAGREEASALRERSYGE
jgi:hypothetical protein